MGETLQRNLWKYFIPRRIKQFECFSKKITSKALAFSPHLHGPRSQGMKPRVPDGPRGAHQRPRDRSSGRVAHLPGQSSQVEPFNRLTGVPSVRRRPRAPVRSVSPSGARTFHPHGSHFSRTKWETWTRPRRRDSNPACGTCDCQDHACVQHGGCHAAGRRGFHFPFCFSPSSLLRHTGFGRAEAANCGPAASVSPGHLLSVKALRPLPSPEPGPGP